ncbi:PKD-like family lipoprotein [Pedobacter deserti]|uniref:PKD-like family lipoprotein n=1 Tax=Pedobacter deserti TaxID=2817382 RepID=UPI00210E606B|nr:PKD-like family lipoprotein [Pedobacter sp. SYSU D00382]
MKIKYKILHVILLVVGSAITGCYKDDSTLDTIPVNTVEISDPANLTQIVKFQGDSLKLKPTLSQSLGSRIDELEFKWIYYQNNGSISLASPRFEVSNEYELKIAISNEYVLGEPYVFRLEVKDKKAGVASYINYNVLIGNKYGVGWLILEDKAGAGDLSFIFNDYTAEHQVYTSRNTAVLRGPRKLEITPFPVGDEISATGKRLYILADQGSQEYNYLTMVKKFDYSFLFFKAPASINPTVMTWTSQYTYSGVRSPSLGIAINGGKLHSNLVGGFPGIKKWGDVAQNPQKNQNYDLAPFVVGGTTFPAVVYDNLDKRFYHVQAYNPSPVAGTLEPFPTGTTSNVSNPAIFDMNNVGMTMIFQDSTEVLHEYNAIMKSEDNLPYMLRYKTVNTTTAPIITIQKLLMNAPDILSYSAAAASTTSPSLYYAKGNIIRRYETSSNTVLETYSFPANETVTAMKYARYSQGGQGSKLVVATWNGTVGKVYFFTTGPTGAMGSYTNVVGGFAKIVDLAYKY